MLPDLYYSKDHEWIKVTDNVAVVGVSDHAQVKRNKRSAFKAFTFILEMSYVNRSSQLHIKLFLRFTNYKNYYMKK